MDLSQFDRVKAAVPWSDLIAYARKLEAESARLREALAAASDWIADGGHVDDDDVRGGATGARSIYEQARATLKGGEDG